MHSKATFLLNVDVPFPLNVTPASVIEATGNLAVQRTLTSLMDTLCASIVRDHIHWAKAAGATSAAKKVATSSNGIGGASNDANEARQKDTTVAAL
jgi:hypothetical protein